MLERFARVRAEHDEGRRPLPSEFWIVSNVAPSESLKNQMRAWPSDVFFMSPDWASKESTLLPPAWLDLDAAIAWCISQAAKVPFPSLAPSTMVWKLAGMIQAASAGTQVTFETNHLPVILEQLVVQLQKFPQTPSQYRPHEMEPPFDSETPVRLLTGFSGSGKTTWAAQGSQHSAGAVAYFDIGDMPTAGIAGQLAREVAAILSSGGHAEVRQLMAPGAGGLQLLVALDGLLVSRSISLTIVLDNAHRANTADLSDILKTLHSVKWVVLGQPWPGSAALEAVFGMLEETLLGWSILTIGAVFNEQGAPINPELAEDFRRLTGGLPLYVRSAARIAGSSYAGDAQKFCEHLKSLTHAKTTGQEEILNVVQKHLSAGSVEVSAVMSLADVPLTQDEVSTLMRTGLSLSSEQTAAAIRELRSWGIVNQLLDGDLVMHDSFRIIARQSGLWLEGDRLLHAREALVKILMRPHAGPARARLLFTLLPAIGKTDELIDFASGSSELLHEMGISGNVGAIIKEAVANAELTSEDRFWAVQTLLFWDLENDEREAAEAHYAELATFSAEGLKSQQQQALLLMEVLMCGIRHDRSAAQVAVKKAQLLADDAPSFDRVLKYNYALTLYRCDDLEGAKRILERLTKRYLEVLHLQPGDFIARNPEEIAPKLDKDAGDDVKRFADVLSLLARIGLKQGDIPAITSINAFKFYVLSHSYRSAVKWMQDVVDQLLMIGHLPDARQFIEGTLPVFSKGLALDLLVPVYSQYAVVLAYCGEVERARQTISELEPFLEKSQDWQAEVENQKRLIEQIAGRPPERSIS